MRCKCYHHCAGHFVHTDELRACFVRGYILTKKVTHFLAPCLEMRTFVSELYVGV